MKKTLLLLLLPIISTIQLVSQDFCQTQGNFPNSLENIDFNFINTNGPYSVRVFFHIIRRSNGTGGQNTNILPNCLNILNTDFNAHNISFINGGSDFIDSDRFFSFSNDDYDLLISTNMHNNAIDIYILPPNVFNGGRASGIPGRALVIGGNSTFNGINTSLPESHVISHEMGHCLGLFHTFHGTCTCERNLTTCSELVNGSNSTTCGDLVSDTPADPIRLFSENLGTTCTWNNITMRDANNQLYNPDERLIMAYTYPQCMQLFSNGQGQRMREHLATSFILQSRIIPNDIFVQNETFSSGQTMLFAKNSIMAGRSITTGLEGDVIITENSNVTFQAGNVILLKPGFSANIGSRFLATIAVSGMNGSPKYSIKSTETYYPFLDNDKWFEAVKGFEYPIICSLYTKTNNNTTLGDKLYIEIKEDYLNTENKSTTFCCNHFIREDVINRKIYSYDSNAEKLLYDFSLKVGDKISGHDDIILERIDSVVINAKKRARFTFGNSTAYKIVWIEGIGNTTHPFHPEALNEGWQQLICITKGNNVIYDSGDFYGVTCSNSNTSGIAITYDFNKINLFPNPTTGILNIFNPTKEPILEVNIYNSIGQNKIKKNTSNISSGHIDISSLSNGIYFVNLKTTSTSYIIRIILNK